MKKFLFVAALSLPLSAQWTVWDPTNYGINLSNLEQAVQDAQKAEQYYQMARNAAAFVNNPAYFLASAAAITNMAMQDAVTEGWTTEKKRQHLQARLQMGQVLMQESQTIGSISHGNASNIGGLAASMQQTAEQLAQLNKQLQEEQRRDFYRNRPYQPQAATIAAWRMK